MDSPGKILVPLDFAIASDKALQVAADTARRLASSVTLMHAYDGRGYAFKSGYITYSEDELRKLTCVCVDRLEAARRELERLGVKKVDMRLVEGLAAPAILALASAGQFHLIVMATHGKATPWQRLIGLVAEDVLSEAPCPVVMVNDQPPVAPDLMCAGFARSEPRHAH